MRETSAELARRLAGRVIDVCRRYLPNGKRIGDYWIAGDVRGAKGRSLFVRLAGPLSGKGAAGKWSDAATGEHGDLLDLIAAACSLGDHHAVLDEARRFLGEPLTIDHATKRVHRPDRVVAARRLFDAAAAIAGTLAERYLDARGLTGFSDATALRFHRRCFYRTEGQAPAECWPALIAAVTDEAGAVTGVLRTYLARDGRSKAPVATPRKALGKLAGNAVRFGAVADTLVIGEGLETVLSLRTAFPALPLAAALSAQHLRAFRIPRTAKRLIIAVDRDEAGLSAAIALQRRAQAEGVEAKLLVPRRKDFNDDLRADGPVVIAAMVRAQVVDNDRAAIDPHRTRSP